MLTKRYMTSVKNIPDLFQKIIEGTAPTNFNLDHLKAIGFTSSNDRAFIPLLKDLGFLTESGVPKDRYHSYRAGGAESKRVLGEGIIEAYEDIFHINAKPTEKDRESIIGRFKTAHNVGPRPAECMATTFFALLKLSDLDSARKASGPSIDKEQIFSNSDKLNNEHEKTSENIIDNKNYDARIHLRYNIEVHLPATKDIDVYNAIFKSIKDNFYD